MPKLVKPEDLSPPEFATLVARMGAEGKNQQEIADALNMSRNQVRYKLSLSGYLWTTQVRVKMAHTGEDILAQDAVAA